MLCPACRENNNKVIDSRLTESGTAIRRRRLCLVCDRRFTTKERVEEDIRLSVIKASGLRVPYNREKILAGVQRACSKLDLTAEALEQLVDRVEGELFANHEREVTTEQIGQYVGHQLQRLHPVAYVRFMSVHRRYSSVDEFIEGITDVRERAARDDPAQKTLFET